MELIDNENNVKKWYEPETETQDKDITPVLKNLNISKEMYGLILKILTITMSMIIAIVCFVMAYIALKHTCLKCMKKKTKGNGRVDKVEVVEMKKLNRKQRQIIKNLPSNRNETSQFLELD